MQVLDVNLFRSTLSCSFRVLAPDIYSLQQRRTVGLWECPHWYVCGRHLEWCSVDRIAWGPVDRIARRLVESRVQRSLACIATTKRTRIPLCSFSFDREYGKRYTVWQNDADDPSGYRLLKAVSERPVGEALDDIYDVANGLADEDSSPDFLDSVAKFVRDFGRL